MTNSITEILRRECRELREIVRAKDHELALLRDLARQHESDRERADDYERTLTEIGRITGCGHLDFNLARCVQETIDQENTKLRKIAAHVPSLVWIKAKEAAGFGDVVSVR